MPGPGATNQRWTNEPEKGRTMARSATIGRLAVELAALTAAGDTDGARIVHSAIRALLARVAA